MGDRFHGMARRAEGSGLNRGARYWWFESTPLQRGVNCEPDFYPGLGSRGRERLRRLTGYKPDEKVRQKPQTI